MPETTVIVGAGQAGGRAAEALRAALPARRIVLIGNEGHPPYERPPLSKQVLQGSRSVAETYLFPSEWYAENAIDLRLDATVTEIDRAARRVVLGGGERLGYDELILATGARPRRLSAELDIGGIAYLRDHNDAARLAKALYEARRLVVIGAGFIGLEVAASARAKGVAVVVVDTAPQAMGRAIPREVADLVAGRHRQEGVDLRLETGIAGIARGGDGFVVTLTDGTCLDAGTVVAGIGAVPNTELAEAAGLAVEDGILTDWEGRTSDPTIRAAGDCTRHFNPLIERPVRLEAWQNAQDEGIAVARSMAGVPPARTPVPWFWSDQFDLNIQCAGFLAGADATVVRRGSGEQMILFALRGGRLIGATAINAPRDMRAARRLIETRVAVIPEALADPATRLDKLGK